ncbi:hypothetical protein GCM10022223_10590 [Kineosporia mesophila]|uniref:Uncharacterized protein n=1 Tax=Kineosporia mesophila TaxID=566012 RepID=A0ABP6Z3H6_9ACTN|nr:hypothetical protein [Kineosporia mesophila]MCD5352538.1 hypothetical protein [Kineosporia mesophila]
MSPEAFGSVEVGDSQVEVRDARPDAAEFTEADIYGADGARKLPIPEGASYEHYMSSDVTNASGSLYHRFCFRDGKLVEKESVVGA